MEKRVLLAVCLSFIVLWGYTSLYPPTVPTAPTEGQLPIAETPGSTGLPNRIPVSPPTTTVGSTTSPVGQITAVEPADPQPINRFTNLQPKDVVVETDAFRAVFSSRGGELVSWQLKDYLDRGDHGEPVELIPRELPQEEPWPFSLLFEDEAVTRLAHAAIFRSSHDTIRVSNSTETLVFDYEDVSGLRIQKRFVFDPAMTDYTMVVSVEASLNGSPLLTSIRWGPALGGVESTISGFAYRQGPRGVINGSLIEDGAITGLDITRLENSDVRERATYEGQIDFAGVDNHYFMVAALPGFQESVVRYRPVELPSLLTPSQVSWPFSLFLDKDPGELPRNLIAFDLTVMDGVTNLPFFIGPKDFGILEATAPSLTRAIDFGFMAALVVPLHRSLMWVYGWVGNYGTSIIVVTLLINLFLFPLRHKSVVSMRKMQEMQPEMKAIQDRYAHLKATDPEKQKMQKEISELWRDRGANPVSGCLPMILTMPFLFAFYRLLSMAVEIRGEPFLGWITDLAVKDPFFITPIMMGLTMIWQQRLQPMQGDPMQQKMMKMMPVIFSVMFLWAPSGLVIYWLTSNVITIIQTKLTYQIIGAPKVRTMRPAAERQIKQKKAKAKSR